MYLTLEHVTGTTERNVKRGYKRVGALRTRCGVRYPDRNEHKNE